MKRVQELHALAENHEHEPLINGCKMFQQQLEMPPIQNGHVQALLIEALVYTKNYSDALNYMKDLVANNPDEFKLWLDQSLIERLTFEIGINFESVWNPTQSIRKGQNYDDDIEEQIN